ncbi:glycosyltransferase [Rhodococcus aetherivorans]|uniref:glycosyltransferase n=1 Tax=Rhodococcus aetherivorans TaxID=191292 RepID=UPI00365BD8B6
MNPTNERRLLLAASTGGHLEQLARLAPQLEASGDSLWITFDTAQSRSLLAGKNVLYVPYIAPRDVKGVVNATSLIRDHLKREPADYAEAVSTGAALAIAALTAARSLGIKCRYIESVSRTRGPSLTGRILHATRFSALETQHPGWASQRWVHRRSVLDAYSSHSQPKEARDLKLLITLGTIRPFRFDSAVDAVLRTGLANEQTVWQVGCTTRRDIPGEVHDSLDSRNFDRLLQNCDAVITHSGVGTILKALESGKHPVVLPRRRHRREHVDDHQVQIAELVNTRRIGTAVEVDELTADIVCDAAARRVEPRDG